MSGSIFTRSPKGDLHGFEGLGRCSKSILTSLACEMFWGVTAALLAVVVCWLSGVEGSSTPGCRASLRNRSLCCLLNSEDLKVKLLFLSGPCPVNVTSRPVHSSEIYSEILSISFWLKTDDFPSAEIEIYDNQSQFKEIIYPLMKRMKRSKNIVKKEKAIRVRCPIKTGMQDQNRHLYQWKLVHNVRAEADKVISVRYHTSSISCNISYKVNEPVPAFDLEVNPLSKYFNVTVGAGDKPVYVHLRYRDTFNPGTRTKIIPSQSQSAVLDFPYLLPCTCVEVYYTDRDARRQTKCPFSNPSFLNATDVWSSSHIKMYETSFTWNPMCLPSVFNISASLCWKQDNDFCVTLGTSLEMEESRKSLKYNTSQLDKHPQMCVEFSLEDSHYINCSFKADMSSWEVSLGRGKQSVLLYLTSSIPATFSAQLCVLKNRTCVPAGEIHSVTTTANTTDTKMKVPVYVVAQEPCVQVWRSSPALLGRRILCPDYAHRRQGLYAVAAAILLFMTVLVITFLHRLTKSGTTAWLCIQKPALLVCSSEQSAHISAVCALASILQGELSAPVHLALWALRSQTKDGAQAGVADLGPLPWLYGQWEAVGKEQGKVLIVWSSEAKKTYEKWKEGKRNPNNTETRHKSDSRSKLEHEGHRENAVERPKLKRQKQKDRAHSCEEEKEPCTVIAPVFMAALACLEGALQRRNGQGVAFVYFQGFCHNRDIPKAFRGIPRYCLPQDFRGLIQELGAMRRPSRTGRFSHHCLPRLLSKIMSVWLARRLAQKLQTLLPQTQGKKKPGVPSRQKQNSLKSPPPEDAAGRGTSEEREALCGSPTRGD